MTSVWGREVKKDWQKAKIKKVEKTSSLREEEGGGVKLRENQAEVICEPASINMTFVAIKALPLTLLFPLTF